MMCCESCSSLACLRGDASGLSWPCEFAFGLEGPPKRLEGEESDYFTSGCYALPDRDYYRTCCWLLGPIVLIDAWWLLDPFSLLCSLTSYLLGDIGRAGIVIFSVWSYLTIGWYLDTSIPGWGLITLRPWSASVSSGFIIYSKIVCTYNFLLDRGVVFLVTG